MAILEVQHIEKSFGATQVLQDISFGLERGQALAIIGSSGSGKTTLLRCLNFLETPDRGSITVDGHRLFDAADPATQRESEIRKKNTRHDRRTLRKLRILNALPVRWRGPLLAAYNRLAWAIARKGM